MDITKFIISDSEYIKFHFEQLEQLNHSVCVLCYKIDVDYVDEKQNVCIKFGYTEVAHVCYLLTKSSIVPELIDNKMQLSKHLISLGLEVNNYFEGISESDDCFKYLFLSNSHKQVRPYYNSWLYNNESGDIIFEITPFYPWHDPTEANNPDFVSYETWIKDYKPKVRTTVSSKNIYQWIQQGKKWCKFLEDNDQKSCC